MKNNYQKIAVKIANSKEKILGFITLDEKIDNSDISLKIAKEVSKLKKTVYIDFSNLDNYILSDINSMIKKEDKLSLIDISLVDDMATLISKDLFEKMIVDLKNEYDIILINEQKDPILSYLLAKYDDKKILIANENKTSKSKFVKVNKELIKLDSPIMGVVYHI